MVFELELPEAWKVYNIFHISLLEPYKQSSLSGQPKRNLILSDDDEEEDEDYEEAENITEKYELEEILDSYKREGQVYYLCKWKGYTEENDFTEEPANHILSAKECLYKFHGKYPKKPRDVRI